MSVEFLCIKDMGKITVIYCEDQYFNFLVNFLFLSMFAHRLQLQRDVSDG